MCVCVCVENETLFERDQKISAKIPKNSSKKNNADMILDTYLYYFEFVAFELQNKRPPQARMATSHFEPDCIERRIEVQSLSTYRISRIMEYFSNHNHYVDLRKWQKIFQTNRVFTHRHLCLR